MLGNCKKYIFNNVWFGLFFLPGTLFTNITRFVSFLHAYHMILDLQSQLKGCTVSSWHYSAHLKVVKVPERICPKPFGVNFTSIARPLRLRSSRLSALFGERKNKFTHRKLLLTTVLCCSETQRFLKALCHHTSRSRSISAGSPRRRPLGWCPAPGAIAPATPAPTPCEAGTHLLRPPGRGAVWAARQPAHHAACPPATPQEPRDADHPAWWPPVRASSPDSGKSRSPSWEE